MQNMATHCWLVGETDTAADLYHQVVVMNESLFPSAEFPNGHPRLQQAYAAWSDVLVREKRFDEAEIYAAKSHDSIVKWSIAEAKAYPRGHDELADSWIRLGRLRRARGRLCRGEGVVWPSVGELRVAVFRGRLQRSVVDRPGADPSWGGQMLLKAISPRRSTYHRRSLAIRRRLFPQPQFPVGHPVLANALRDLGITCLDAGEPAEAFRSAGRVRGHGACDRRVFLWWGLRGPVAESCRPQVSVVGTVACRRGKQAGIPSDEVYQYVWMRHGFVPRLIADRQRALRTLARETEPAIYEKYVTARQNLARILLVSVTDDAARNAARLDRIQQLNSTKEDLEHQLTRGLESTRPGSHAATDVRTLVNVLPERSVFVDFFSFSSLPYDATVPSRSNHGAANQGRGFRRRSKSSDRVCRCWRTRRDCRPDRSVERGVVDRR